MTFSRTCFFFCLSFNCFSPLRNFVKVVRLKEVRVTVILLQIVMVSPGTHLVKKYESLSITNESQFQKTISPKLKMLGPLYNQTVISRDRRQNSLLQFTEIKI